MVLLTLLSVVLMLGPFIFGSPTNAAITAHQVEESPSPNRPKAETMSTFSRWCQDCYVGDRSSKCTAFLNRCDSFWQEQMGFGIDPRIVRRVTERQSRNDLPDDEKKKRSTFCSGLDDLYLVGQSCRATNGGLVFSSGVIAKLRQSLAEDIPDVRLDKEELKEATGNELRITGGANGPFRTPSGVRVVIRSARQIRISNLRKAAGALLQSSGGRFPPFRKVEVDQDGNRWIVTFLFSKAYLAEL